MAREDLKQYRDNLLKVQKVLQYAYQYFYMNMTNVEKHIDLFIEAKDFIDDELGNVKVLMEISE